MSVERRMVCKASDPQWLEERRQCVTGSDIPILFESYPKKWGVQTPEQLKAEKLSPGKPMAQTKSMWWGVQMERPNLEAFGKLTGLTVEHSNDFYRAGVMGATIDGWVSAEGGRSPLEPCWSDSYKNLAEELEELVDKRGCIQGLLEMKNVSSWGLKEWQKAPPEYYWQQCQAQMWVVGAPWCILCAKIGSSDMIAHVIEADEIFCASMLEKAARFWEEVESARRG